MYLPNVQHRRLAGMVLSPMGPTSLAWSILRPWLNVHLLEGNIMICPLELGMRYDDELCPNTPDSFRSVHRIMLRWATKSNGLSKA